MLSTNNSNLLQNKKPIKDLKSIFKDKSKNTISPRNINNKINNNIYEKIRKNSSSKIENSTSNNNCNNKIYFNHFEIRMHRFVFSKVILINLMFHLIIILTKFLKHFPHHHLLQLPYIHVL